MVKKLQDQSVFVVGVGGVSCQYLKLLKLAGVGSGPKGRIVVTDPNKVESNDLCRQILFQQNAIGENKARAAITTLLGHPDKSASAVHDWSYPLKVTAHEKSVYKDSEDVFSNKFWSKQDAAL